MPSKLDFNRKLLVLVNFLLNKTFFPKLNDVSVCILISHKKVFSRQGDGTTWEIHLGTRLRVKVVPPLTYSTLNVLAPNGQ